MEGIVLGVPFIYLSGTRFPDEPEDKMIEESIIRKWHRNIGIVLAPLIFLQAISGMVIAFEVLLGIHHDIADLLNKQQTHALHNAWDYVLLDIHYGGGYWGAIYHLVLVLGLIWLIITGAIVYFRLSKRQKNSPNKAL